MTDPATAVIEGRISRKANNALVMTFRDGPGEPIGQAVQSSADGFGSKMGVLFGFKNGGTGVHVYTPASGEPLHVLSRDKAPTLLTRPDGAAVATIERGPVCTATTPDGGEALRWADHPDGGRVPDAFRLVASRPSGEAVARVHLILAAAGWSLGRELLDDLVWFGHAGQPLKLPFLGASVEVLAPLTATERELLIASCIDMAIGLRRYGSSMG